MQPRDAPYTSWDALYSPEMPCTAPAMLYTAPPDTLYGTEMPHTAPAMPYMVPRCSIRPRGALYSSCHALCGPRMPQTPLRCPSDALHRPSHGLLAVLYGPRLLYMAPRSHIQLFMASRLPQRPLTCPTQPQVALYGSWTALYSTEMSCAAPRIPYTALGTHQLTLECPIQPQGVLHPPGTSRTCPPYNPVPARGPASTPPYRRPGPCSPVPLDPAQDPIESPPLHTPSQGILLPAEPHFPPSPEPR